MTDDLVAAVREAAADGIDFDGLAVDRTAAGYRVGVGEAVETIDDAALAGWIQRHRQHVGNWWFFARAVEDERPYVVPFLRWLERAEVTSVSARYAALSSGITRSWGQLRITASRSGDRRRYMIRHAADADEDAANLTTYDDPTAATDLARFDDAGRYRPLKSAPTLVGGWTFPALSPADAIEVIDRVYPVSIADWHAERSGRLDVRHFRETADRQSGIYREVGSIPDRGIRAITHACCTDATCLKRRHWEIDDETAVDVPPGDGRIPCREPCSLYLEAARTFAPMASEPPPRLPAGLRAALLELCDDLAATAPADVRVAAMDEPRNRYRLRFLRAWITASARREDRVDPDRKQADDDHEERPDDRRGNGRQRDAAGDEGEDGDDE